MMPGPTQVWIDLVARRVDLAITAARGEPTIEAAAVATALDDACRTEAVLAFVRLARRLELSREEQLAAWCLIAGQLVPAIASRLELLASSFEVTLGALAAIAYRARPARAIDELGTGGKLFRFGLVEPVDDARGTTPSWSRRTVRATDRLLALALATEPPTLDPSLSTIARIDDDVPAIANLAVAPDAIARTRQAIDNRHATLIVAGRPGLGRRTLLVSIAREHGLAVLQIDARKLSRELPALRAQLRQLARECAVLERTPLLIGLDELDSAALEAIGTDLVAPIGGVLATTGPTPPALRWGRPTIVVDLPSPSADQLASFWLAALGQGSEADGEYLATHFPLAPGLIRHAATAAKAGGDGRMTPAAITYGIRTVLDDRLGSLATRLSVSQTWDDLVLSDDHVRAIVELLARVRERRRVYERWGFATKLGKGLGVSALFSGPPGTGKSMVAALIAKDLGLEVYQVDLAKIMSRWIGETEKKLGELFDAAEAGHAVLLFDEADAMFGKRTDVKSSNDRYANLETNYLLQRLESFTGICLLTTNHESNLDPAFLRRLSLHLRFELPDAAERERLWRSMLPETCPVEGALPFDSLARRFVMSGGYIRNAVLRAAFLAADERSSLNAAHLEYAARIEYEGLGKIAA